MKLRAAIAGGAAACLTGCSGIQSALAPAAHEAERIANLFWWMTAGAIVVWLGVIALALYYARVRPESAPNRTRDRLLIVGAGVVFPVTVLTALLIYGLSMLPPLLQRAPAGSLLVHVDGEQWWWRVRYYRPGQPVVETANEIRLPVGQPVQFRLTSDDVIHSFWVPSLGGKMDMIPGRITYLALRPRETGIFAGACAEYCGASHAFMRFYVQVVEPEAFERWIAVQAAPAPAPATEIGARGQTLFLASGCGACHAVRGTPADGLLAPDLTHVGSRLSLAAGTLPNDLTAFHRWVALAEEIKPEVHMPAFSMLPAEDLQAIAAYLEGLE